MNISRDKIISIVTPSFNQADFIESTILSIISQKGDFFLDYVIIDGGSHDGSVQIIEKYEKLITGKDPIEFCGLNFFRNDPLCKFNIECAGISYRWISESDKGHGNALNKGFKLTIGEIMGWLNSDDMFHQECLSSLFEIFNEHQNVEWVTGKNSWWNSKGESIGERFVYKNIYDYLIGNYGWIQQESTFWRRSLWNRAGGCIDESYRFMVDGELWSRFFLFSPLFHVDKVLSGYRFHQTNRAKKYINEIHLEMKRAIFNMKSKVDLSFSIDYPVIKKIDGQWVVNSKDSFESYLELVREKDVLNRQVQEIRNSYSYRLGHAILWPIRVIRKISEKIGKV